MKIRYLLLLLVGYSCQTTTNKNSANHSQTEKSVQTEIVTENRKYYIGDINNDNVNDTAFVNFKWNLKTNAIECGKNNCDITIVFKKNIPKISFSQSLGIVVAKSEDVNHDNANEILVFSRTNEGWWHTLSVWTYTNKTWKLLAETDAFISTDTDSENRVRKENGTYYLIGDDKWHEDENGDFKKIKIKL